jgi:hypothetical protein
LNKKKEKREEKIKREVRRMSRNAKKFFKEPTFFTTLIIIMMAFNQGAKYISVDAYTRRAPQLQPWQVIFKRISNTTYRLEYANIEFNLDTHIAERAVQYIPGTLVRLGPCYHKDSKRREDKCHMTDKKELTFIINRYRQINTLLSLVPEPINYQTGRRRKRGAFTTITIGIMAILATSSVSAHMASSSYGSYNKVELRKMENKVNIIKNVTIDSFTSIEKQFNLQKKRDNTTLQALNKVQESIKRRQKVLMVLPLDQLSHQLSKALGHEHWRYRQCSSLVPAHIALLDNRNLTAVRNSMSSYAATMDLTPITTTRSTFSIMTAILSGRRRQKEALTLLYTYQCPSRAKMQSCRSMNLMACHFRLNPGSLSILSKSVTMLPFQKPT